MYRIGEFSELTNLSVKTLRYYNDEGVLIPEEVDVYSNYRYYSDKNIQQAKMINSLKLAGFKIKEIKDVMNNLTDETLLAKRQHLINEMFKLEEQIKQVDSLRDDLPNEHAKVKTLGGLNEENYNRYHR